MKNFKYGIIIAALSLALLFSGCGGQENINTPGGDGENNSQETGDQAEVYSGEILINAAASLREPMQKIGELYKEKQPELTVSFNFGASGALLQQIQNGAPADIFLSAAQKQMNTAQEEGLIVEESRFDWLQNKLVVAVPVQSQLEITAMEDILKAAAIALGAPDSVPAGAYAKEALEEAGLWESVSQNLVQGKDVSQVLAFVESGSADAGFVYLSDLFGREKAKKAFEVPDDLYSKVIYPGAVIKNSQNIDAARAFLNFLKTPEAGAILEEYGFTLL